MDSSGFAFMVVLSHTGLKLSTQLFWEPSADLAAAAKLSACALERTCRNPQEMSSSTSQFASGVCWELGSTHWEPHGSQQYQLRAPDLNVTVPEALGTWMQHYPFLLSLDPWRSASVGWFSLTSYYVRINQTLINTVFLSLRRTTAHAWQAAWEAARRLGR